MIQPFLVSPLEGTTKTYSTIIVDEAQTPVPAAAFTSIKMTYYSRVSMVYINGRNSQDVLNTNDCTIDAFGLFQWKLAPADVQIVETPVPPSVTYRAIFVFKWLDSAGDPRWADREIDVVLQRAQNAPFA